MSAAILLLKLACLIIFTATLIHAALWGLRRVIDRAPTELDVPVTYDPLSPEPFVEAQETEEPAPTLCVGCGKSIISTRHWSATNGPFHTECLLDYFDSCGPGAA